MGSGRMLANHTGVCLICINREPPRPVATCSQWIMRSSCQRMNRRPPRERRSLVSSRFSPRSRRSAAGVEDHSVIGRGEGSSTRYPRRAVRESSCVSGSARPRRRARGGCRRVQRFPDGPPAMRGRFHHDLGDVALGEPLRQGAQLRGAGPDLQMFEVIVPVDRDAGHRRRRPPD
jgi:hypothetical protein